jgi:hypothetical protein
MNFLQPDNSFSPVDEIIDFLEMEDCIFDKMTIESINEELIQAGLTGKKLELAKRIITIKRKLDNGVLRIKYEN